jgi:hypothetical protein
VTWRATIYGWVRGSARGIESSLKRKLLDCENCTWQWRKSKVYFASINLWRVYSFREEMLSWKTSSPRLVCSAARRTAGARTGLFARLIGNSFSLCCLLSLEILKNASWPTLPNAKQETHQIKTLSNASGVYVQILQATIMIPYQWFWKIKHPTKLNPHITSGCCTSARNNYIEQ